MFSSIEIPKNERDLGHLQKVIRAKNKKHLRGLKMVKKQITCSRLKDLTNVAEIPAKGSEDTYQQYNNSTASNLAKQIKK